MTAALSHQRAPRGAFVPVLRVARPCRSLHATAGFYTRALKLELLESFIDHAGFDGVILGRSGWPYHLELTHQSEHAITPRPTAEDLLVLYFPDHDEWHDTVQCIRDTGARPVPSRNPYCDRHGLTFEDPDGYRMVIANIGWP